MSSNSCPYKPRKVLTEKQKIKLRVKNNEPIDWGTSDESDADADNYENEQLERARQEREIEQEY